MGLSQPKQRQRIDKDPRNKKWSDDSNRIGLKLLSKMGWSEGNGLGANQCGIKTNIKATMKTDTMGIGAIRNSQDNWLENAFGFDDMLKNYSAQDTNLIALIPEASTLDSQACDRAKTISNRHAHRKKFVQGKKIAGCKEEHLNNVLGKKRNHSDHDISPPIVEQISAEIEVLSEVPKVGINEYFAQKMAEKGIKFGSFGCKLSSESGSNVHPTLKSTKVYISSPVLQELVKPPLLSKKETKRLRKKEKRAKRAKKIAEVL